MSAKFDAEKYFLRLMRFQLCRMWFITSSQRFFHQANGKEKENGPAPQKEQTRFFDRVYYSVCQQITDFLKKLPAALHAVRFYRQ